MAITTFNYRYKDAIYIYTYTNQKVYHSHPYFYGDVINNA